MKKTLLALALFASSLSAQNIRTLPRATAITGVNDSALVLTSDSASRTRGVSTHELFKRPAGSVTRPSYSFALDSTTGFYRAVAGQIGVTTSGVQRWRFNGYAFEAQSTSSYLSLGSGSLSTPAFNFEANGDGNTGIYQPSVGTLALVADGVNAASVSNSIWTFGSAYTFDFRSNGTVLVGSGSAATPGMAFSADTDVGLYRPSTNAIAIGIASNTPMRWAAAQSNVNSGSAVTPAISFYSDVNTDVGFYRVGEDTLGIAAGGNAIARIQSTGIDPATNENYSLGSATHRWQAVRSLVFRTETAGSASGTTLQLGASGRGIYSPHVDSVAIAIGDARKLSVVNASGTTLVGGAGSMAIVAGTGNSRGLTLYATNSSGAEVSVASFTAGSTSLRSEAGGGTAWAFANATTSTLGVAGTNFITNTNAGSDTTTLAMRLRAPALTAASGTPNTVCIDATTKELLENAAATCTVSSARYKRNIRPLSYAQAQRIVMGTVPATFTYRNGGRDAIGFIAEQVDTIDKRLTVRDKDGKPNAVNYEQLVPALVLMVQRQQKTIDSLTTALKRKN